MFTARSILGLAPVQSLEGLAALGTLAALPADLSAGFGRIARRYPSAALLLAAPAGATPPVAAAGSAMALPAWALRAMPAATGAALGRYGVPAVALHAVARALAALSAGAERLGRYLARRREMRLTEHALRQLDTHTLRDIGLTRSEIGSAAAEAAGVVEATRERAWREIGGRVY